MTKGNQQETRLLNWSPTDRAQFLELQQRQLAAGWGPAFLGFGLCPAWPEFKVQAGLSWATHFLQSRKEVKPPKVPSSLRKPKGLLPALFLFGYTWAWMTKAWSPTSCDSPYPVFMGLPKIYVLEVWSPRRA